MRRLCYILSFTLAVALTAAPLTYGAPGGGPQPIYLFQPTREVELRREKPVVEEIRLVGCNHTALRTVYYAVVSSKDTDAVDGKLYKDGDTESAHFIQAERIEVKTEYDSAWQRMDSPGGVKFIDEEYRKSSLDFRISEESWAEIQSLPSGEYTGYIEPTCPECIPGQGQAQGRPFRLKVTVHIEPSITVDAGDISMTISDPTAGKSESTGWTIDTNIPVNITFSSSQNSDLTDYSEFFLYELENLTEHISFSSTFSPGESVYGTAIAGFHEGGLRLRYNPAEKSWHELPADDYSDIVTITVSPQ